MAIQLVGGKLLFVGGKVAMHADCCCEEEGCCAGGKPTSFQVVIANISGTCVGVGCGAKLNGTFTLTTYTLGSCTSGDSCCWLKVLDEPLVCSIWALFLEVVGLNVTVGFLDASTGFKRIRWDGTLSSSDCTAISSKSLSFTSDNVPCSVASSTCVITAT